MFHISKIDNSPFTIKWQLYFICVLLYCFLFLLSGNAFPWTISLHHFSMYTLFGKQVTLCLVEPMGCTSTLAVTSQKLLATGPDTRHSFVVCLHVDLESLQIKCSNPQVSIFDL